MSESVTLKSYFYEVLIPSSQKNTSSPIEDILHHVSISFMKKLALYKCFNPRTHTGCDKHRTVFLDHDTTASFQSTHPHGVRHRTARDLTDQSLPRFNPRTHTGCDELAHKVVEDAISFNPRTHTGCDSSCERSRPRTWSFNPRTHTGCDFLVPYNV